MNAIVRTLLIISILVFGIGCKSQPKKAEPVNLGGVAGGVLQAADTTAGEMRFFINGLCGLRRGVMRRLYAERRNKSRFSA